MSCSRQESLRITPIVPAALQRALKDFELSGAAYPKGDALSALGSQVAYGFQPQELRHCRWSGL